jgi:hypothetical protein
LGERARRSLRPDRSSRPIKPPPGGKVSRHGAAPAGVGRRRLTSGGGGTSTPRGSRRSWSPASRSADLSAVSLPVLMRGLENSPRGGGAQLLSSGQAATTAWSSRRADRRSCRSSRPRSGAAGPGPHAQPPRTREDLHPTPAPRTSVAIPGIPIYRTRVGSGRRSLRGGRSAAIAASVPRLYPLAGCHFLALSM